MGRRVGAIIVLVALASFAFAPALAAQADVAYLTLIDGTGRTIGVVELRDADDGLRLYVRILRADDLQPGTYGIHFHAVGRCDTPDFQSAGAHFNPTGAQHGAHNPQGPHAGDLPNLTLDQEARDEVSGFGYGWGATTTMVTLLPGPASLRDADGSALVIHAHADDQVTDPAGNSGPRIACAALAGMPGLPNTGAGGAAGAEIGRGLAGAVGLSGLLVALAANAVARRRRATAHLA